MRIHLLLSFLVLNCVCRRPFFITECLMETNELEDILTVGKNKFLRLCLASFHLGRDKSFNRVLERYLENQRDPADWRESDPLQRWQGSNYYILIQTASPWKYIVWCCVNTQFS